MEKKTCFDAFTFKTSFRKEDGKKMCTFDKKKKIQTRFKHTFCVFSFFSEYFNIMFQIILTFCINLNFCYDLLTDLCESTCTSTF